MRPFAAARLSRNWKRSSADKEAMVRSCGTSLAFHKRADARRLPRRVTALCPKLTRSRLESRPWCWERVGSAWRARSIQRSAWCCGGAWGTRKIASSTLTASSPHHRLLVRSFTSGLEQTGSKLALRHYFGVGLRGLCLLAPLGMLRTFGVGLSHHRRFVFALSRSVLQIRGGRRERNRRSENQSSQPVAVHCFIPFESR